MIILTPKVYKKGLKWSLNKSHLINTFKLNPYLNISEEMEVASVTLNNVIIPLDGNTPATLPYNNFTRSTHIFRSYNFGPAAIYGGNHNLGKAIAGIIMGRATGTINTDEPIDNPYIKISVTGKTYKTTRQLGNFDGFPKYDATSVQVRNFVSSNYDSITDWTDQSEFKNYVGTFLLSPWIRSFQSLSYPPNFIELATPGIWSTTYKPYGSNAQSVIVNWNGNFDGLGTQAYQGSGWEEYLASPEFGTSLGTKQPKGRDMYPSSVGEHTNVRQTWNATQGSWPPEPPKFQKALTPSSNALSTTSQLTKVNNYRYDFTVNLPVSYVGMAASRYTKQVLLWYEWHEWDRIAWADYIQDVTVTLMAYKFLGDTIEKAYSLDEATGSLTSENLKESNIVAVPISPLVKTDTQYGNYNYDQAMATYILNEYKDGKYVVSCTVQGLWALENQIEVNLEAKVKLLGGEYISKYSTEERNKRVEMSTISVITLGVEYALNENVVSGGNYGYFEGRMILRKRSKYDLSIIFQYSIDRYAYDSESPNDYETYYYFYSGNAVVYSDTLERMQEDGYYLTIEFLEEPTSVNNRAQMLRQMMGVYDSDIITTKKHCVFQVKNISKVFNKRGFTWDLKLLEHYLDDMVYKTQPASIDQLTNEIQYYVDNQKALDIDAPVGSIEVKANNILVRIYHKDSLVVNNDVFVNSFLLVDEVGTALELVEQFYIGRIVINKATQSIVVYKWVTGTTYSTYKTYSINDLVAAGNLFTFELANGYDGSFKLEAFLETLGGFLIEE